MTEIDALREAMEPFARLADAILAEAQDDANPVLWTNCAGVCQTVTLDQLRAVSSALARPAPDQDAEGAVREVLAREVLAQEMFAAGYRRTSESLCKGELNDLSRPAFLAMLIFAKEVASERKAEAVLAERERCIDVINSTVRHHGDAQKARDRIATAIRAGISGEGE